MTKRRDRLIDRLVHRSALRRWRRLADGADGMDFYSLRRYRNQALSLRRNLDRVIHSAEYQLALPVMGSDAFRKPMGTDWAWRPTLWKGPIAVPGFSSVANKTMLCDGVTVFHDCRHSELTVRQVRNTRDTDLAPFGVRMDVFRFDGSFLSLVLELPPEAVEGLRLTHLIRLDTVVAMEKPLEIFARLNIKHGPNVEQVVRELPLNEAEVTVEFDLAYTKLNEKRAERIWVDLIFESPQMNQITLHDVTFSRRPRAEL
ncbi:DUF6478 family protein [Pseudorhodobacter sp.]|uniref:DUF6478 family protein n=1 Tax=Pseudorhodobacter sp. TaxID=1934400 RepID=UPI0039E2AEA4